LDKNDPFLEYNLDRLEKRFRERYLSSLAKDEARRQAGKDSHQTVLKSIADNQQRFLMVRLLRHLLLKEPLELELPANSTSSSS